MKVNKQTSYIVYAVIFLIIVLLVLLGNFAYQSNRTYRSLSDKSIAEYNPINIVGNYIKAHERDIPHLHIDLKFKHLNKLREIRDAALDRGMLFRSEDDLVPATIRLNGKKTKVRLRLKGDHMDHLKSDKWSMRIEVRRDNAIFGMRRFSLQSPVTKYFYMEPLFLDHLREEGVLSIRYFFVDVTLNGKYLGVMAVEEHFSKELLESQKRREGVIIRYTEDDFWKGYLREKAIREEAAAQGKEIVVSNDYDNWRIAPIKPFRSGKVRKSPTLSAHAEHATKLLRGLAFESIKPSDVFDTESMGKYLAICELWKAWHSPRWHNIRFYVNPFTSKLEPIGFDASIDRSFPDDKFLHNDGRDKLQSYILTDPDIQKSYKKHVKLFTAPFYIEKLKEFVKERESIHSQVLHKEFPRMPNFDFSVIEKRAAFLRENIETVNFSQWQDTRASSNDNTPYESSVAYGYINQEDGRKFLEIVNPLMEPIQIEELRFSTKTDSGILNKKFPISIQGSKTDKLPSRYSVQLPESIFEANFEADIKIGERVYKIGFNSYPEIAKKKLGVNEELAKLMVSHPLIEFEEGKFVISAGEYEINEPIIFPDTIYMQDGNDIKNPGLVIEAGVKMNFSEDSFLELSGPLKIFGKEDKLVVLQGQSRNKWKGVFVKQSPEKSYVSNAIFKSLDFTKYDVLSLTGGVTFYESDLEIENSSFEDVSSEDALNVVRANIKMTNTSFKNTVSDAFDCDFCEGIIEASKFENVSGDGVDVSGTIINLENTSFVNIKDKAVSIGEASNITAKNLTISNSGVGIVSKDKSQAYVENVVLNDIKYVGLMAYVKKKEYGGAKLDVKNIEFNGNFAEAISQNGSTVILDGKEILSKKVDIEELYKEGHMKK